MNKLLKVLLSLICLGLLVSCGSASNKSNKKIGWFQEGEENFQKRYYNEDGTYLINIIKEIDGNTYSFDEDGYLNLGFHTLNENGKKDENASLYYFDLESGELVKNKKFDLYEIDENGIVSINKFIFDYNSINGTYNLEIYDKNQNKIENPKWLIKFVDEMLKLNILEFDVISEEVNEIVYMYNLPIYTMADSLFVGELVKDLLSKRNTTEGFIKVDGKFIRQYVSSTYRHTVVYSNKEGVDSKFIFYNYFIKNSDESVEDLVNQKFEEIRNSQLELINNN